MPFITRKCDFCGKEFSYDQRYAKQRRFCSTKCSNATRTGANHPRWIVKRTKVCWLCKSEFEAATGWKKQSRFCSDRCYREACRINGTSKRMPIGTKRNYGGYIRIKLGEKQWVHEHNVVAEKMIGRPLKRDEIVHHRNGIKHDNREVNLEVMTRSEHMRIHAAAELIGLSAIISNEYVPSVEGMAC